MGCNQSKVAPGEPETKEFTIQHVRAKSKGRQRCRLLKMFRKHFRPTVSPIPPASMTEEHTSPKSPLVTRVSSPATPTCQVVEGPSDEDSKAGALPFDGEEVFAEGCNWDLPAEINTSGDASEMGEITETTATIEEELELELQLMLNNPSTPELNVTGSHIKLVLTEEQVVEAIRWDLHWSF